MTSLASASFQLLRDLGKTYTLKKSGTGNYDPATGQSSVTVTTSTFTGKLIAYRNADVDGTAIQRGDRRLLVAASSLSAGVFPETQDVISGDGNDMNVVSVQKIEEGSTVAVYACQVRI
jgi:hypothetical protein